APPPSRSKTWTPAKCPCPKRPKQSCHEDGRSVSVIAFLAQWNCSDAQENHVYPQTSLWHPYWHWPLPRGWACSNTGPETLALLSKIVSRRARCSAGREGRRYSQQFRAQTL